MTLWQDPPPQTRRQARANERAAALRAEKAAGTRRAATDEPTPAGEIPAVKTSQDEEQSQNEPARRDELYRSVPEPGEPEAITAPVSVLPAPAAPTPVAPTPAAPTAGHTGGEGNERTLTRRELRAMLHSQESASTAPATPEKSVPEVPAAEAPAPEQAKRQQSAAQQPAVEPPTAQTPPRPFIPPAPVVSEQADTPQPAPTIKPVSAVDFAEIVTPEHKPDAASESVDSPGYARSRVVSGSATNPNALILPIVPSVADATGPLTSTGEILVTGSIDLPRSLGATGHHSDRFDSSDIDRLFDQPDEGDQTDSNAAPVRASRAISTHTSTRDVIAPRKRRGNKLPTILAITAAALALGVVGLLVAGYIFRVF